MNSIGFSTGALAKGDFRAGIGMHQRLGLDVIELSALRDEELAPLVEALDQLQLAGFRYISLHAPSRLDRMDESDLLQTLMHVPPAWPIIVHPDVIEEFSSWRFLGSRLCIENMDQRKPRGRTVEEMEFVFERLPEASFCFDIGHARQVDPTMGVAIGMLKRFQSRLRQVHMSEVDPNGRHIPIGFLAESGFRRVAKLIPDDCPVILESMVLEEDIAKEIEIARHILGAGQEDGDSRGLIRA